QGRPWIHTRTFGPDGKEYGERWFSPQSGVKAVRHGLDLEFHDRALRTSMKFVPAEGVIYRLPENPEAISQDLRFYEQLLDPGGPTTSPVHGMDVVAQSRRDVVLDGRAWVDIEMTLRVIAGDRKQNMRVRIDRATKLPHSINFQAIEGGEGTILFDY